MLLVDTGPLVAAASPNDEDHVRCLELLANAPGPLVVPTLVIAEVAHFLALRFGPRPEIAFASSLQAGDLVAEPIERPDWTRIRELLDQYADLGLGITDASVVVACERLGATELATLDRRHFSVVRPSHRPALTLLPG